MEPAGDEVEVPVEIPVDGILAVRIVHGRGNGTLRRTVHALLEPDVGVLNYGLAGPDAGGWGATLVTLASGDELTPSR